MPTFKIIKNTYIQNHIKPYETICKTIPKAYKKPDLNNIENHRDDDGGDQMMTASENLFIRSLALGLGYPVGGLRDGWCWVEVFRRR